jgi:hypothetical protein
MDVIVANIVDGDAFLGLYFMKSNNVTLNLHDHIMTIQGLTCEFNCIGNIGCYRVVVAQNTVIARSEVVISGKVNEIDIIHNSKQYSQK